ncbi:MAG: DUF5647 family protein [candidate division WOR-3 bacterium]|nr:DUF5647 family protein [candidate division WOR-3 bacterium]
MRGYLEKNSMLVKEFDHYILKHPEFADEIPDDALVVMQLEGDEEFNRWARETASEQAEEGQRVVYITITKLGPVHSRIEELKLETVSR